MFQNQQSGIRAFVLRDLWDEWNQNTNLIYNPDLQPDLQPRITTQNYNQIYNNLQAMETETQLSQGAPPIFDGDNYQVWAVRMKAHLDAMDVWEAVEEDYEVPPLRTNPTMAQMKMHKERKNRKSKAKACLFAAVSNIIFTRIMNLESTKDIWEYLKKEYKGNERTKNMQVLNLIREFEMLKMKESETIKEYSDKLLGIVNKVRLLGKDFSEERIVQKVLVTLPEKYESKISALEEAKDLSSMSLAELVNALQA